MPSLQEFIHQMQKLFLIAVTVSLFVPLLSLYQVTKVIIKIASNYDKQYIYIYEVYIFLLLL
jgi:hypothetical protein